VDKSATDLILRVLDYTCHHLPPWIRSFDLFRHRRVLYFIWVYLVLCFVFTCTVVVLKCFVMCGCVYVRVLQCVYFGNMYTGTLRLP